ncbi:DUF536 domain-containing protein [Pediococcus pentosaceus]|uniref:DUF536 domain-containing protein n=1 Tax=Pediococcus pentosaceus TaxID=1255 RepID=UPI003D9A640E
MSGKELKKGQVLFTTEAPMGNVAQVPDNNGYILSQRTVAFETKDRKIDQLKKLIDQQQLQLATVSENKELKGHVKKLSDLLETSKSDQS